MFYCSPVWEIILSMRDFRLPPRSRYELRSSELLRSNSGQFITDVSGQLTFSLFQSSDLLPLAVCPCHLLHNCIIVSPSSERSIFTMEQRRARTSAPLLLFFGIYLFIKHILHTLSFPFSRLAHVDVLLFLVTASVRIASLTERLSSKLIH